LNFEHGEALLSADRLMLFKLAAHAIAEQHGAVFSMMPKPFADQPGSGMHMHVSLWQGADCVFAPGVATKTRANLKTKSGGKANTNANARTDPGMSTEELSLLGRQFMAGVLAHSAALAALAAPTVNSYKRLGAGDSVSGSTWAPTHAAHGPNNRTALLRTLPGRFEWRLPDASCNPYITLAGLIMAGLDGVDRQLDPGVACTRDLYADPAASGAIALPVNLAAALQALEADAVVRGALGAEATSAFFRLKHAEWQAYAQHVSHWELDRYAALF
jgi:glutamine synthetase